MNAELLLDAFERLGDEPGTVQRLRRLIVGLAISGKFEAAMDPANLLKEIEARMRNLLQQGVLRKRQHAAQPLTPDELPEGFNSLEKFVRLGNIARIEKGQTGIMRAMPGAFPLVVTGEERGTCDHFDFDGAAAIVPLVSSAGHGKASLQRLHYQDGKFALGSILAAIFPYAPDLVSARFLFEYLTAFKDELLVSRMIGTANVSLSVGKVADVPVPLILPATQRKVDELMGLCDRLEAARAGREAVRDRLAAASLTRLDAPDPETFQSDARFALDALPALTTRRDQIKALRQTILNLAVRGKLVPQDPNDERASELLRRIAAEKARLVKAGEIRKLKPVPDISAEEQDFYTPLGWTWSRLGELTLITQGFAFSSGDFSNNESDGPPLIKIGDIGSNSPDVFIKGTFDKEYMVQPGDLLLGLSGSIKCAIWRGPIALLNQRIARILPATSDLTDGWLLLAVDSCLGKWRSETSKLTVQNIRSSQLFEAPIPLPPLAEQHRIVAKVDELMGLCDRLEASLTDTADTRRRLLDALLAEALAPFADRDMEAAV